MTNPTQPIEHYTLEQVVDAASNLEITGNIHKLHALINACCNELIGEPVAEVVEIEVDSLWHCSRRKIRPEFTEAGYELEVGAKLYTLKEPKP